MIFDRRNRATMLRQRVDAAMSFQLAMRAEMDKLKRVERVNAAQFNNHSERIAYLEDDLRKLRRLLDVRTGDRA